MEHELRHLLPTLRVLPWFSNQVVVESPYAGDIETNVRYARALIKFCLDRGENPFASHLFFTQEGVLDDTVHEQRVLGMTCGFHRGIIAPKRVFGMDRGMTGGMKEGMGEAIRWDQEVEYVYLPGWEDGNPPE